jgi:hypothetical protein
MVSTSETVVTDVVDAEDELSDVVDAEDELSDAAEIALVDGEWVVMC